MQGARTWLFVLVGVILVCGLLVAALFVYATYASRNGGSEAPLVQITGIVPEGTAAAGQPVIVFAEARDPGGIARVELWVNGEKAATQENPGSASPSPFNTSQAWMPGGAGDYLLLMKAINRRGAVGESDPLLIHVGERSFQPDAESGGEYIVQAGDTWESIAALFDTTPDDLRARNPGVDELTPGARLRVPPRPEGDAAAEDAAPPIAEAPGDVPRVDPPAPGPPPAPGGDAEADPEPGGPFGVPLPGVLVCLLRPELCEDPMDSVPPPSPRPDGVEAAEGPGCGVEVVWVDNSENETGFRLYRFTSLPRFRMDLLELFGTADGSGTRLHYLDELPPNGTFIYAVAAYNAGGSSWSPPSLEFTSRGCAVEFERRALVVEALSMTTPVSFDRLYCYASLADSSFERVPYAPGDFITPDGGGAWNIAAYFSGENKRTVIADAAGPLNIEVECLGWQGADLINLGRFAGSHPPEEWDGRELIGQPSGGEYRVAYRINPSFAAADESGTGIWPLVDPSLPAPFDLRQQDFWHLCRRIPGVIGHPNYECTRQTEPGLAWDYAPVLPTGERSAEAGIDFNVYMRHSRSGVPTLVGTAVQSWSFGLPPGDCSQSTWYSVSALVGEDPETHERIQSPLSEDFLIGPTCAALEIRMLPLWVYGVGDGDPCSPLLDCRNDYEAYGWIVLNGQRITWNDHCDPGLFGGCLRSAPNYTAVVEASEYDWADMWLNLGDGWRRSNTSFRIPINDGEPLNLAFQLWDHDELSADDLWCGMPSGRSTNIAAARSAAEWLAFDQEVTWDSQCILRFHVRGVPPGG